MSYPDQIELAREKIRQAESALSDYLHNPAFDSDQAKQLMNAVKVARDEFINQAGILVSEFDSRF